MKRLTVFLAVCMIVALTASPGYSAVAIDEENFPDATFRGYVSSNFDANEDGILSNNEILAAKEVNVNGSVGVKSYQGIKHLTSLERFTSNRYDILSELDLSGLTALSYVEVRYFREYNYSSGVYFYTGAEKINVKNCTSLQTLYCYVSEQNDYSGILTNINLSGCNSLLKLQCYHQQLTGLDVTSCEKLVELYCQSNKIPEIDLSNCPALETLDCHDNILTGLDLNACKELTRLECYDNQLNNLNVRASTKLRSLNCARNHLVSLNVSNNSELTYLHCHHNDIQALDLSNNKKLEQLHCHNNRLPLLDTSGNTSLKEGTYYIGWPDYEYFDNCKFSPQNINGLEVVKQSDGAYSVNLRDYLATKVKNVSEASIYAKDDENKLHDPTSYNAATGILTFSVPPSSVYYEYDTKYDKEDTKRYMSVTIAASGSPVITTNSLPSATVGTLYAMEIEARGEKPLTLTLTGNLPEGLSFNAATGEITGTPTQAGKFSLSVTAANDFGTQTKDFILYVWSGEAVPIPAVIITPSVNNAVKGNPYSAKLEAAGDTPITWTASGLPAGLTLNSSTGEISGTLTTAGTFTFSATATNAAGSDRRTFTLKVTETAGKVTIPSITTDENLGSYTAGDSVSITLTASGTTPITWTHSGGTLPAGLSLADTGVISGTVSGVGTFTFTVKATNSAGEDMMTFTMRVSEGLTAPMITTAGIPSATTGLEYRAEFDASGSTPITWTYTGTLPPGLTLSEAGLLSGTPTTAGTYTITLKAKNAAGADSKSFTFTVYTPPDDTGTPPAISTTKFPDAFLDWEYSFRMEATGSPEFTWTCEGLPDGMTIDDEGYISGTPTKVGTFKPNFTVSNGAGSASKSLNLKVSSKNLRITPDALPAATWNKKYNKTVKVSGMKATAWSLTGDLPEGMTFDTAKGKLSGTPKEAGLFDFTITATNGAVEVETTYEDFRVKGVAPKLKGSLKKATVGASYSATFTATGTTPITWDIEDLPDGLTYTPNEDGTTCSVTGTPESAFNGKVSVKLTNGADESITKQLSFKVVAVKPKITSSTLPDATTGREYSAALAATGSPTITWEFVSGNFPSGLTLEEDGTVSGVPDTSTTYKFKVRAANSGGKSSAKQITLRVNGGASSLPAYLPELEEMTGAVLPAVSVDEEGLYEFTVSLDVGIPVGGILVWHSWPDGEDDPDDADNALFLDADGEITETVPEDYSVTVNAWLVPGKVYEPVIAVKAR